MHERPIHILAVNAGGGQEEAAVTVAVSADAGKAISTAISEQLDRARHLPMASAEDVLAMRAQLHLLEQFAPIVARGAHAVITLTAPEVRRCLLTLTEYAGRVDGEHYQAAELRERIQLIAQITPVLWDANEQTAATTGWETATHAHQPPAACSH